jgi:quinol monooxygenase YgiN
MSIIAIASYRPKKGMEKKFLRLLKNHIPTLRAEGLISDKDTYSMRAENGTIIEVFEWKSSNAKIQAHKNENVMNIWNQFFDLADLVGIGTLKETKEPFASFKALKI